MRPTRAATAGMAAMAVLLLGALLTACASDVEVAAEGGAAQQPNPTTSEVASAPEAQTSSTPVPAGTAGSDATNAFSGMTVEFVVPFEPGGGYDVYARLLAPDLSECLGAEVIVVNEPGAGGLLATNQTWIGPPDGSRIQIMNTIGVLGSYLGQAEGVQYEPADFSWIGRFTGEPDLLVTAADGRIQSLEDMVAVPESEPVTFAATGTGSNAFLDALIVLEIFDVPGRVVSGFSGGEGIQALLAGDVDAESRSLTSQLPQVLNGEATAIMVMGSQEVEELPGVPTLLNVEVDDETDRAVLEQHAGLIESGRSIAGPPDMDPNALQQLRDCYEKIATDAESPFRVAAEVQGRILHPMTGEQLQDLISNLALNAAPEYVDIVRSAYSEGP